MSSHGSTLNISQFSRKISEFIRILQLKDGVVSSRSLESFLLQDDEFIEALKSNNNTNFINDLRSYLENKVELFSGQIDKSKLTFIRASVQGMHSSEKVLKTVDVVISTIIDAYYECLDSFEKFDSALVDLLGSIEKAGEQTVEMLDKSSEYIQEDTEADKVILNDMREINTIISTDNSLEKIQSTILGRIDIITSTLEKKITLKEERSDKIVKELDRVKKELHMYKDETVELKTKVDKYQHEMIMDKLTGLHRKDYLETVSLMMIDNFVKLGEPFTVIIFDLDDFKHVNDTYGHVTGDEVLKKCGEIVRRRVRGTDSAFRYGGEEFLIILGNAKSNIGCSVAYSMLEQVRVTLFKHNQVRFQVTASFGVAGYVQGEDIMETIERADQNLYKAKDSGKNAVFCETGKFTGINRIV